MSEWNKTRIVECKRAIEDMLSGPCTDEFLDALSEIERLQSENAKLKELIGELVTNCESLAEEYSLEDEGNHPSGCALSMLGKYQHKDDVCTCGYKEKYQHNTELIEKAKEMMK